MNESEIAFIGGGNMAMSLIGGLVANGHLAAQIRVSDIRSEPLDSLQQQFGVKVYLDDGAEAVAGADAVVLAVKPQGVAAVAQELGESLRQRSQPPLLISIAAGVRSADLLRWLGGALPVVRTMPNTPALLRSGVTGLYAGSDVSPDQRELATAIMGAVGVTVWVGSEAELDAVTAISGSGPAYFFLLMEAIEATACRLGLSSDTARVLTLQTALGAARMALETTDGSGVLRRRVTSPGGTTERAIATTGWTGAAGG